MLQKTIAFTDLVLSIFNEGAYMTFMAISHKALNLNYSLIVKTRWNPFLEPTNTKQ